MPPRSTSAVFSFLLALTTATAQEPPPGVEVLARGPVHEAYATTAEFPTAGPVVAKAPPESIEELPPDQRPEGDNVQWVPGYWHWDEERNDFIWISGFWRVPPPGRVWVPGSWRGANGGYQWTPGFWQTANPAPQPGARPQTEIEYYPEPPPPLDIAPSVPAPDESHFYAPGSWVWRDRYVWQPGCWMPVRPGWVWVPAHYRWTPCGYVFVSGYWDHRLEERGVLFAPVVFAQPVYLRPAFVYTPCYVVSHHCLFTSLFVRRGCGAYYFGDYFEAQYARGGYYPWAGSYGGSGFAISIGFGRRYDPLWGYYSAAHHHDPHWARSIGDVYAGRYRGDYPRPPRTLIQQNTVINNITNVTNTTTTVVNNVTMVAPLQKVQQVSPAPIRLAQVRPEERAREQEAARELRRVAVQRERLETSLAARNPAPTIQANPGKLPVNPVSKPQQVKLDVPRQAIARAQVPTAPDKAPPPVPKATAQTRPSLAPISSNLNEPKVPRPPTSPPARPALPPTSPPKELKPSGPKGPSLPPGPSNPKEKGSPPGKTLPGLPGGSQPSKDPNVPSIRPSQPTGDSKPKDLKDPPAPMRSGLRNDSFSSRPKVERSLMSPVPVRPLASSPSPGSREIRPVPTKSPMQQPVPGNRVPSKPIALPSSPEIPRTTSKPATVTRQPAKPSTPPGQSKLPKESKSKGHDPEF